MKLKELKSKDSSLEGTKVKTPKGVVGYWKSQWHKGVWLNVAPGKSQMYPQFVDDLRDCLEWEVTEEDVNCDTLISLFYIDNTTRDENI